MPNVINNFLVGIGFEYDRKAADQIGTGIDSIKSKALQLGTVVAGAFGIKALSSDFASATDSLGKFSQVFGVLPDDVHAFGQALATEGGSLESYMSQLQSIEQMRAGLLRGDAGFIAAAGKAGIDTTSLTDASNATEAYLSLADQFVNLSQQQRINAAQALGLDEASIRLLSSGRDNIEQLADQYRRARPVTRDMTEQSALFNRQLLELSNNVGGYADRISARLIPAINSVTGDTNEWFKANQSLINQGLDDAMDAMGDSIGSVGLAGGLVASSGLLGVFAGLASYVPIVGGGLSSIALALARISAIGAAGATGVAIGNTIYNSASEARQEELGRTVTHALAAIGVPEAQEVVRIEREREETRKAAMPLEFNEETRSVILESQGFSPDTDVPIDVQQFAPTTIYDALTAGGRDIQEDEAKVLLQRVGRDTNPEIPADVFINRSMLELPDQEMQVSPVMGGVGQLPDQELQVSPVMGGVGQLPGQELQVSPVMGGVGQLPGQELQVSPVMGGVGQLPGQELQVSPVMGGVGQLPGQELQVSPVMGGVGQLPGQELQVSPVMGGVGQLSGQELQVSPVMGGVGQLPGQELQVSPVMAPFEPSPVDIPVRAPAPASEPNGANQTERTKRSEPTPARNTRPLQVDVKLDGQVLGRAVIDIMEQQNQTALDDVMSSTEV